MNTFQAINKCFARHFPNADTSSNASSADTSTNVSNVSTNDIFPTRQNTQDAQVYVRMITPVHYVEEEEEEDYYICPAR
jgi:hypothetical protein